MTNTHNTIKASDIQRSDKIRETNQRSKFNSNADGNSCFICGKGVSAKAFENAWHIHMSVDHEIFDITIPDNHPSSQGWFPIGAECAKQIPRTHKMKFGA